MKDDVIVVRFTRGKVCRLISFLQDYYLSTRLSKEERAFLKVIIQRLIGKL